MSGAKNDCSQLPTVTVIKKQKKDDKVQCKGSEETLSTDISHANTVSCCGGAEGCMVTPTKEDLKTSRHTKKATPLLKYRRGRLCVTDITSQSWCEQHLLYTYTVPTVPVENEAMTKGSSMHLARELEVHDIVPVTVTSKEDSWAIKFLNMIDGIKGLTYGSPCIRELPIFGEPFGKGIFVVGIIDEIRYNEKGELVLCEFKSRAKSRSLPSRAQKRNHALQVMIYKQLFDELVLGHLTKEHFIQHVGVDETKQLGEEVMQHMGKSGISCTLFGELLDIVLLQFQFSDLPCVDSLVVEYCFQGDCQSFASDTVKFDSDWLMGRLDHYFSFWRGQREVEGVDIEEAWKCHSCDFTEICEWKKRKEAECIAGNRSVMTSKIL
ncbi:exonuclease V-like [Glandiceps talaboti]